MPETQKPRHFLTSQRQASLWKLLPWTGLASILLGFGCGIAALVIGFISDGLLQNSWSLLTGVVQPSVLLSVTATLANAFLRAAFTEGTVIAWWVQAHQGIKVATLHASYDHAYTFLGFFTSLLEFSRVKVAALAMFLLLLDRPFLQRASSVQIILHTNVTKLTIPVSPSPFLLGATGLITAHDGFEPSLYTPSFAQVAHGYNTRVPISIPKLEYPGTVTMDLVAPGFDVSCINGSSSYRLESVDEYIKQSWCSSLNCPVTCNSTRSPISNNGTDHKCTYNVPIPPNTQTMFKIEVDFQSNPVAAHGQSAILLHTSYKSTPKENGTLSWRNCILKEAIIRYPVEVDNGTVTLLPIPLTENRTQHLILREKEWNQFGVSPSTIGGLWIALNNQYQTSANVTTQPPAPYTLQNENAVANQFFAGGDVNSYDVMWSDPTDVIIAAAHELALRTAISLTNMSPVASHSLTTAQPEVMYPNLTSVNRSISQEVTAIIVSTGPFYHTDLGWLISGFIVILLASLAVVPLYWAWWELERSYTLNPIELSKAFDAPLLRLADTNMPSGAWSRDLRKMQIQYGTSVKTEELLSNVTKDAEISQSSIISNVNLRKFRKMH